MLHIITNYALQRLCCSPHNLCNEEGKINGLPLNRPLRDDEGNIYDIIAGVFYVTGEDDDGNLTSLNPEMMEKYRKEFSLSNGAVIY